MYFHSIRVIIRLVIITGALAGGGIRSLASESNPDKPIEVANFFNPNTPDNPTTRRLIELMEQDTTIKVRQWGGLALPGIGKATLMMAIAGKTAPAVGLSWFHVIRSETKNGFLAPLNEWIGEDINGNGEIDDFEAKWDGWKKIHPLWRRVATVNGKVYGLPMASSYNMAIVYRTDLVRAAGLNPNEPPKNWNDLIYWCRKITASNIIANKRHVGIALASNGNYWLPWMLSAGGEPIIQVRRSPKTGREYTFPMDAVVFKTNEGEDLSRVAPAWRANFAAKEGIEAADLYYNILYGKWVIDPDSGSPVGITPAELTAGKVSYMDRVICFTPEQVISGAGRMGGGRREDRPQELLSRGEVAMLPFGVGDLAEFGSQSNINPDLLSWFPFPAGPGPKGRRVVQKQQHFIVAYEDLINRPPEYRNKVWKVMGAIADENTLRNAVRAKVIAGLARFCSPDELNKFGYGEYISDIPLVVRKNFQDIEDGKVNVFTEPWMGFWLTMDIALGNQVFSLMSKDFDYKAALKKLESEANSGVMFEIPKEKLDYYRPVVRVIFIVMTAVMGCLIFLIVRSQWSKSRKHGAGRNVFNPFIAAALIMPAILLILLWKYYPLIRGLIMAFQDYKITGDAVFVGLDNFVELALNKSFWMSMLRTLYFAALNLILAFLMPIFLAIILNEARHCKIFFRTLFFLPQMTSGLVIALLWKLMYTPTPDGFLNQMIGYLNYLPFINIAQQTWLQDPKLAMLCCVIPTVWASMGMSSLIYLAALQSVPPDFYEAAEIDGAGILHKLRHITLPILMPLIIINFVGAFIGTFQNMGNIFLMTFGGPGEATTVASLKIWMEAYNNLRFSMATSMAWVLGSMLVGFSYLQIQLLNKVEYRKAQE